MEIIKKYSTTNDCYKKNKQITVKGVMLHSVGCPQPHSEVFAKNQNKAGLNKCVHAYVDAIIDGKVIETLPTNHRGWHCGKGNCGSANNTHIGVEMCEPSGIKYTKGASFKVTDKDKAQEQAKRTYETSVDYFAYLCELYKLNPLTKGVIMSHSEGYRCGVASNHADCEHLWKGLNLPYTMEGFRTDVALKMGNNVSRETSYKVKIMVDVLNIRSGAGTSNKVVGTVKKNEIYTILDEINGWGRLKSGVGYICLKYTQKI